MFIIALFVRKPLSIAESVETIEASPITTNTSTTTTTPTTMTPTTTELTPPPAHTIAPTPTTVFAPPPIQFDKNIEHLITTVRSTVSTSMVAEVNSDYIWHAAYCNHKLPLVIATVKNVVFFNQNALSQGPKHLFHFAVGAAHVFGVSFLPPSERQCVCSTPLHRTTLQMQYLGREHVYEPTSSHANIIE